MKHSFTFLNLKVYEHAVRFCSLIIELTNQKNKYAPLFEDLKNESLLLPQALAYSSNYKETEKQIEILQESRGICFRLVALLEIGKRKKLFTETNWEILLEELESLSRKISNLIFSIQKEVKELKV